MARPTSPLSRKPFPKLTRNLFYRGGLIHMEYRLGGKLVRGTTGVRGDEVGAVKKAEAKLAASREATRLGVPIAEVLHRGTTLGRVLEHYLEWNTRSGGPSRQRAAKLLLQHFGDRDVSTITTTPVASYAVWRAATSSHLGGCISPRTYIRELQMLRAALKLASEDGWFPLPSFTMPRAEKAEKKKTRGKIHSVAKIRAVIAELPPLPAAMMRFAYYTGMRHAEIVALTEDRIIRTPGGRTPAYLLLDWQKTKDRRPRRVLIGQPALDAIDVGLACGGTTVFPYRHISVAVARANERLGHATDEFVTMRDMRHDVATRLYRDSQDRVATMVALGHTTSRTADTYQHTTDDRVENALVRHANTDPLAT